MNKFPAMLLVVLILVVRVSGQQPRTEWSHYCTDSSYIWVTPTDMYVDASGFIFLAATGQSVIDSGYDLMFMKYSPAGERLWTKYYGGPNGGEDRSEKLFADASGNFYLTGWYQVSPNTCAEVVKFTAAGDTIWSRQFVETCGLGIWVSDWQVDASGNIYLGGKANTGAETENWIVAKYLADGSFAWMQTYQAQPNNQANARALAVDAEGSVYATGMETDAANATMLTIKYSANGSELWRRTYATLPAAQDAGRAIAVDGSGNVIVVGQTAIASTPLDIDMLVVKYSPDGDTLWARQFGATAGMGDFATLVKVDYQNGIVVAGYERTGEYGISDLGVIKYSAAGQMLWQDVYGDPTPESDYPTNMIVTANGQIVVLGVTDFSDTYDTGDLILRKYDPDGHLRWTQRYLGIGESFEFAQLLAQDTSGSWLVGGWSYAGFGDHRAFINKYSDFVCGDASGEGAVDISDAVYLIQYIFASGPAPNPLEAGDANCDGAIDISDAVYLISYIFAGGPAPCAAN